MRAHRLAPLALAAVLAACSAQSPAGPAEEAPRVQPAGMHRDVAPPDTTAPADTTDATRTGYLGSGHRAPPPQNTNNTGSMPLSNSRP